jgi:hypothetical protein
MGLIIDLPGTMNANRLEAVIALAIKVAAQPFNTNKPIPRKLMVALEKLIAEGGLTETKNECGMAVQFQNTYSHPP